MAKTLDEPFASEDLERMYTVTIEKTLDEPFANADLERGDTAPYPAQASAEIRLLWAFVRKIYFFLTIQLLLAIAVASVVVFVRPVAHFVVSTRVGFNLYKFCIVYPVIGKVILEAAILTAVVVVSLTLYTFWAARRGRDFSFLAPILFAGLMVLLVFPLIQIFAPMGTLSQSMLICGVPASIILSGFIIYHTDDLIKHYTYDEYLWAATALYWDVINIFFSVLALLFGSQS